MSDAWRQTSTGLLLYLRVTPNAGADRIDGIELRDDGSAVLRVRVKSVADKGKANAAVLALLAKGLDVPKSAVTLISGATTRLKTVKIDGDPDAMAARLAGLA